MSGRWMIAAPSVRVGRRPLGFRIGEDDFVAFRDAKGHARVLLDRCPHRGVQLSKGSVESGHIACAYHGWQFDGEGQCRLIPSLRADQEIPGGTEVASFPTLERDGYVWTWAGSDEPGDALPRPIPEFPDGRWIQSSISMACHWLKPMENNVDPVHAAFAHPWAHPQWYTRKLKGVREGAAEVRLTETGFVLFVPATRDPSDPIPPDAPVQARFDLPNRVTVTFQKPFRQVIVIHTIPTGPDTCRLETMVKNPLPFGPRARYSRREHVIFRQDRRLMESAERWTREIGHDFERSVEADYTMLLLRRIVALNEEGRWEEKRGALQTRRILRICT